MQKSFKIIEKNVVRNGKSCTFAPAFGRNEGTDEGRKREFFESLRPAQDQRGGSRARQGTYNKGTPIGTSRRNPRFRIEI